MALAVCLLFDRRSDMLVRQLWARLEDAGISTLQSHTHGNHLPHLSYAVLLEWELGRVAEALRGLPDGGPFAVSCQGTVTFPRGRATLAAALPPEAFARQRLVVEAVRDTGALVHRHYEPGRWLPHVSVATHARNAELAAVVTAVSDSLPLTLHVERAALIDTADGRQWDLAGVP